MRGGRCRIACLLAVLATMTAEAAPSQVVTRPNIVLIMVDDVRRDDVDRLPRLKEMLFESGVEFTRFVTPNALCGPSRVSTLRAQLGHNTGMTSNRALFARVYEDGLEQSTVATWLQDAGYATGLFGKYLNGYGRSIARVGRDYVPPGWSEWHVGNVGKSFGFWLNSNGKVIHYPQDGPHSNDVLAELAVDFIRRHGDGPMFLWLAPGSSHGDAIPAARHANAFADQLLPDLPAADVGDKPKWIQDLRPRTKRTARHLDHYRNRLRSMLSVEDLVAAVIDALRDADALEDTYIIFTSDNGFHYGEHRIHSSKATAYEEAILVPAAIRGPGIPAGEHLTHLVVNSDLAVTIGELAGVGVPPFVDGKSVRPLFDVERPSPEEWRTAIGIEHTGQGHRRPTFFGIRTLEWKFVHYPETGEEEVYDLELDPLELTNLRRELSATEVNVLRAWSDALAACRGQQCRHLESGPVDLPTRACHAPSWLTGQERRSVELHSRVSCALCEGQALDLDTRNRRRTAGPAARGSKLGRAAL